MSEDNQTSNGLPVSLIIMLGSIVVGLLVIAVSLFIG
jgi:hypothetical protein